MRTFDLDKAPQFTALSYVWGPRTPYYRILVNRKVLIVRKNLYHFLWRFRMLETEPSETPNEWLWIDQLTIDQSNGDERDQQVQVMSEIYTRADSVIVWLGLMGIDDFPLTSYEAAKCRNETLEPEYLEYALHNLYLRRLWIVQDLILAKRVRLLLRDIWLTDFFPESWLETPSYNKVPAAKLLQRRKRTKATLTWLLC